MSIIPEAVRKFNYRSPGVFDHPTCRESEPNYKKLLTLGKWVGLELHGFHGEVIGRIVSPVMVLDPLALEPDEPYLSIGIIKNPLYLPPDHPDQIGANSGLVATANWLYLGRIRDGIVEIRRPVIDIYYRDIRILFDQFTQTLS
jgi:hypothetical protein